MGQKASYIKSNLGLVLTTRHRVTDAQQTKRQGHEKPQHPLLRENTNFFALGHHFEKAEATTVESGFSLTLGLLCSPTIKPIFTEDHIFLYPTNEKGLYLEDACNIN